MERLAKVNGKQLVEESGGGLRLTYAQASKRVNRWAGGIAAATEPGDRVVIATPNGYEMLLLCLAASRAGAVPVPVNSQMRPDEIRHVIDDSSATLVFAPPPKSTAPSRCSTAHKRTRTTSPRSSTRRARRASRRASSSRIVRWSARSRPRAACRPT